MRATRRRGSAADAAVEDITPGTVGLETPDGEVVAPAASRRVRADGVSEVPCGIPGDGRPLDGRRSVEQLVDGRAAEDHRASELHGVLRGVGGGRQGPELRECALLAGDQTLSFDEQL